MDKKEEEIKKPDVSEEINAMISSLGGPGPTPVPEKKEEVEEEKVEVAEEKKEEVKEEVKAEEKKEEPPIDDKDKTIADLRAKLAEREVTKPVIEEKKEEKKELPKEEPVTEKDFVKDIDLDEVTRDPKALNKLLSDVYQQAVNDTKKIAIEGVLKSIPEIVRANVAMMEEVKKKGDEFYESNKDLKPFKKVVAVVFEELAAANPDKKFDEVIKLVGPETRKRLELKEQVEKREEEKKEEKTDKKGAPSLPSKGGRAGKSSDKPPVDKLQDELEEMNKVLKG